MVILRLVNYGISANATLVRVIIILRPNSPEMLTSLLGLDTSSDNFVVRAVMKMVGTLVEIWVTIAAEKGVILFASLLVATIFWTERRLVSMR